MTDARTNWFVINLIKKSTWSLLRHDCNLKPFARGSHIWSELNSACIFDVALCLGLTGLQYVFCTQVYECTHILPPISFRPLSKHLSANVNFFRCVVMIVLSSCHFVLWVNYVTYSERGWHSHLCCVVCCRIPGRLNDRRTPLGELNWIFTAITDTIAWNVLPRGEALTRRHTVLFNSREQAVLTKIMYLKRS